MAIHLNRLAVLHVGRFHQSISARCCRMDQLVQQATAELEQFMAATFNGFRYYDCQFPRCLLWSDSTPRGVTNDSRQTWIWFMRLAEGFYLQPVSATPVASAKICIHVPAL